MHLSRKCPVLTGTIMSLAFVIVSVPAKITHVKNLILHTGVHCKNNVLYL